MHLGFNSSLVRLKGGEPISVTSDITLFQFQLGAIKGGANNYRIIVVAAFQFQLGAIKAPAASNPQG